MNSSKTGPTTGLVVDELSVVRDLDGAPVVREISFTVEAGRILGVVGESGSGKTTLALALLGFAGPGLRMRATRIRLDDTDLDLASPASVNHARRALISYVPQDPSASLNPALSVRTQLFERLGDRGTESTAIVRQMMSSVDLPSDDAFFSRRVGELSGGQQQRVAIAMAAVTKPAVLILDEPTTGLDVSTQASVLRLVKRLCRETGMCGVFISHDLAVIRNVADDVTVLYAGFDIEHGPTPEVVAGPGHPYTEALLRCVPDPKSISDLSGIPGRPPAVGAAEPGCPFAPRCAHAVDSCTTSVPPMVSTGRDASARCFRLGEIDLGSDSRWTIGDRVGPEDVATENSGQTPVLAVCHLDAKYGRTQVLHDVDLHVGTGECVSIVGQSGSGKTTTSRCMIGLHSDYTGEVVFNGELLAPKAKRRTLEQRRRIQYIFQNPFSSLNPRQTVGSSIAAPFGLYFGMKKAEAADKVAGLLDRVGMSPDMAKQYPNQLSGGQQQRIAIARSLAANPDVLICDEITSALDVSVQASLLTLLRELTDSGVSIVFVTHDLGVVRNISDRTYVLNGGVVVEDGPTLEVIDHPKDAYTISLLSDALSLVG